MNDFTDYSAESQRTSEVDELLERNNVSREAATEKYYTCPMVLCENYEKKLPASEVMIGITGAICPASKDEMLEVDPDATATLTPAQRQQIETLGLAKRIDVTIECRKQMQCEIDELDEHDARIFIGNLQRMYGSFEERTATAAEIRADKENGRASDNGKSDLGERIADNLVPSFGETLVKYSEQSLTYGFPPAVDALITKTGIDETRAAMVLANFRDAYALAADWKAKANEIVVTDESQTDIIREATNLHRIIRDERINVEKRRKELKEPSLREGQLIDGVANVYKELLGPIEKHLLDQSRFIQNREAERRAKAAQERGEKLALFEIDPKMFPNLGDMTDEAFEVVYSGVREQYHSRKEAEKEQERQRLERERAAQIENERLRKENERLEAERKAEAERSAEERRLKEIAEADRKKAQDELDRQAAERKAEADRIAAEAEAKRLAPDKDKLLEFARRVSALSNEFPDVDEKWTALAVRVQRGLATIATTIEAEAV